MVRAEDGFPADLRLRSRLPSDVMVDPHRAFGQPIFAETRTRVSEVAAMTKVGEEPEVIADELGVTLDDVRTATAHGFSLSFFFDVPGNTTTRCCSSPASSTRT